MPSNLPPSSLWHEPAPRHFDTRIPWWAKTLLVAALTILAIYFLDAPVAAWTLSARPIDDHGAWNLKSDPLRELAMLEQWGQWVCSILVILAVALIDRAGPRRALAIALACLSTVLLTYLLKDLVGRSRPYVLNNGAWIWGGPQPGFTLGSKWGSFPSAHTTGAFALSVGLAWFYPKARPLFMTLATITAIQRVLHSAHYISDTLAGMGLAVLMARLTFQAKLAGRLLALLPPTLRRLFLPETPPPST